MGSGVRERVTRPNHDGMQNMEKSRVRERNTEINTINNIIQHSQCRNGDEQQYEQRHNTVYKEECHPVQRMRQKTLYEEQCMDLLNNHYTTVSDNRCATKYDTVYDMGYMAVTKQVCKKDHCMLKCRDMATTEGRHMPMKHWFDMVDRQCHTNYVETYRDEHQGNTSTQLEHPLPNEMQRLIFNQLKNDNNEEQREMTNMVRMEPGWIIEPDSTKNFTSFLSNDKRLFEGFQEEITQSELEQMLKMTGTRHGMKNVKVTIRECK